MWEPAKARRSRIVRQPEARCERTCATGRRQQRRGPSYVQKVFYHIFSKELNKSDKKITTKMRLASVIGKGGARVASLGVFGEEKERRVEVLCQDGLDTPAKTSVSGVYQG